MKEPIRHHYIPQFILKNFCFDENKHINYYDVKNNEFSVQETSNIFMVRNLYRDEVNYQDNPVQLENDFSKYEMEVSKTIKEFLNEDSFELTIEEDERLKLFLAIMSFRSRVTKEKFSTFSENDKTYFELIKEGETFEEVWIRNLEKIVRCRSLDEVIKRNDIDTIMKAAMMRDSFGLFGNYFIIAERRGNEDFFISDCYPVCTDGIFDDGLKIPMFSYFPISPSRILILAANGVDGAPRDMKNHENGFLRKPSKLPNSNYYKFSVRKIYEDKVKMINENMFKATKEIGGNIAFKNKNRISVI